MGRTTIEVDDSVRDRLRDYKDSHGMTYNGALNRLLTSVGEPLPPDGNGEALQKHIGTIYECDIRTPPETRGVCTFHERFPTSNVQPVVFGGDGDVGLAWDDFRATIEGIAQYLPTNMKQSSFSIHQDGGKAWYGYGLGSFVNALENRDNRYEEAGVVDPHHSETAVYLCTTEWGLVCISLQAKSQKANHLTIQFMTDGVPLSPHPYKTMAQYLELDLTNAHDQEIKRVEFENRRDIDEAEIVDTITRDPGRYGDPFVHGLIIKNPFYDDREKLQRVTDESGYFNAITTYKHIPFYFGGNHPPDEPYDYELQRVTMRSRCDLTSGFTFTNVECRGIHTIPEK